MKMLIEKLQLARHMERKAREHRMELEAEIEQQLNGPAEGSKTHEVDEYKVSVKRCVNRKTDWPGFIKMCVENTIAPYRHKPELDLKALKKLQEHRPALYYKLAEFITATPGKTAVKIVEENK